MRTAMGERPSALTTHIEGIGKVSITSFGLVWLPSRFLDRETRVRVLMSLRSKYLGILSGMVPAGAVGVLLLLGSAAPCDAGEHPSNSWPWATPGVSERLAAIRAAVSELAGPSIKSGESEQQLAWGNWWRNGGWRNGGWGNWRNGWHNGWPNWWHNW